MTFTPPDPNSEELGETHAGYQRMLNYIPFLVLYLILVSITVQRRLWFDELYTYYISHAPNLQVLLDLSRSVDLNPPLGYVVPRISNSLFGDSILATRFPSVLLFGIGSFLIYLSLSLKVRPIWAATAVLGFWSTPFFMYATEIRPYALLLCFTALATYSLLRAREGPNRGVALVGILLGIAGVMLSHVFGVLSILPLYFSELVRAIRTKKIDWPIWLTMIIPLGLVVIYIPMVQSYEKAMFPLTFEAGPRKTAVFYGRLLVNIAAPVCISVASVLYLRKRSGESLGLPVMQIHQTTAEDWTLLLSSLLPPVLINLVLARTRGAYFERYNITSAVVICVLAVLLVGWFARYKRVPALIACTLFAISAIIIQSAEPIRKMLNPPNKVSITEIDPELPFVVASGLTFLEVDHYAQPDFLRRVYYLLDHDGVVRYAHSNFFENFPKLQKVFPIRAHVEQFEAFSHQHDTFLLLANIETPEAWLLRKLLAEHASVTKLGDFRSPYRDSTVYRVQLVNTR